MFSVIQQHGLPGTQQRNAIWNYFYNLYKQLNVDTGCPKTISIYLTNIVNHFRELLVGYTA